MSKENDTAEADRLTDEGIGFKMPIIGSKPQGSHYLAREGLCSTQGPHKGHKDDEHRWKGGEGGRVSKKSRDRV